ncbi:negative regulator of genetic competence sporulation and motility-like protein [Anopheles sinensis]|uniref:Negative regulator of genetic competence sporulation and motility-like protein n=1 Tax=Anopheles sinensis TaxID=74873 RepID=A0A084VEF0_ANOSI|nr:negative regulator of genetic competence sporulation and motility-like protein [Anopheles sinensis]
MRPSKRPTTLSYSVREVGKSITWKTRGKPTFRKPLGKAAKSVRQLVRSPGRTEPEANWEK